MARLDSVVASRSLIAAPWWMWLTLLSLDAPLVAVVWQRLFAKNFHLSLGWPASALLATAVWLIYVADRLLDTRQLNQQRPHTRRHAWYAQHRIVIVTLWIAVLCISLPVASQVLQVREWLVTIAIGTVALAYMVLVQHRHSAFQIIPKELWIGLVFAVGTTLFHWTRPISLQFGLAVALFANLCALNCSVIAKSEWRCDCWQDTPSIARTHRKWLVWLRYIGWLHVGICALLWWGTSTELFGALGMAGAFLNLFQMLRLPSEPLRVLADVALVLPFVLIYGN